MTRGVEFLIKNNPFLPTIGTTKMIEHDIDKFLKDSCPQKLIDKLLERTINLLIKAQEEIERLRKDEARIDWLADMRNDCDVALPNKCVMNNMDDLRAAIDDAMQL